MLSLLSATQCHAALGCCPALCPVAGWPAASSVWGAPGVGPCTGSWDRSWGFRGNQLLVFFRTGSFSDTEVGKEHPDPESPPQPQQQEADFAPHPPPTPHYVEASPRHSLNILVCVSDRL